MAYELSFSPEFFIGPHDLDGSIDFESLERPTSVYQAILCMSKEAWADLAEEVFDCKPEFLSTEAVLQKIRETNTCRDLRSPVEVCIDEEGFHSVFVYDSREEETA